MSIPSAEEMRAAMIDVIREKVSREIEWIEACESLQKMGFYVCPWLERKAVVMDDRALSILGKIATALLVKREICHIDYALSLGFEAPPLPPTSYEDPNEYPIFIGGPAHMSQKWVERQATGYTVLERTTPRFSFNKEITYTNVCFERNHAKHYYRREVVQLRTKGVFSFAQFMVHSTVLNLELDRLLPDLWVLLHLNLSKSLRLYNLVDNLH